METWAVALLFVLLVALAVILAWRNRVALGAIGGAIYGGADIGGGVADLVVRREQPPQWGSSFADSETCKAGRFHYASYEKRRAGRPTLTSWSEIESALRGNPVHRSSTANQTAAAWRARHPKVAQILNRSVFGDADATLRALRHVLAVSKRGALIRVRNGRVAETFQLDIVDEFVGVIDEREVRRVPDLARRPITWCIYHPRPNDYWKRKRGGIDLISEMSYLHDHHAWITAVCEATDIPDIDIILGLQDRMTLPTPGKSALPHMPADIASKLVRPRDDPKCAPAFTQGSRFDFDNLPLVTADDVSRALERVFPTTCFSHYIGLDKIVLVPWKDRDPRGVFRGVSTGCGTRPASNSRLRLVQLAESAPPGLLDVALSGPTSRDKRQFQNGRPQPPMKVPAKWIGERVAFLDHGNYRVQIDVDGNVLAYRLASLFAFGSAVVRFLPEFDPWFIDLLISGAVGDRPAEGDAPNYYRVEKAEELVPLLERLATPEGSAEAEAVGAAARRLFLESLGKEGMTGYTAGMFAAAAELPILE